MMTALSLIMFVKIFQRDLRATEVFYSYCDVFSLGCLLGIIIGGFNKLLYCAGPIVRHTDI